MTKMRTNRRFLGLALLPLALAACERDAALPEARGAASSTPASSAISQEDALYLVRYLPLVLRLPAESVPAGGRVLSNPCRYGGTITAAQDGTVRPRQGGGSVADGRTALTPDGCGVPLADYSRYVVVSASSPVVYDSRISTGAVPTGHDFPAAASGTGVEETTVKTRGTFTYTFPDGRSGTCDVHVQSRHESDLEARTFTYREKGTVCGYELDVERAGSLDNPATT